MRLSVPPDAATLARGVREHADRVAVVALGLTFVVLPGEVPGGIVGLGLVSGALLALQAAGIVLVYRSNRILNLSQVQTGVLAGVLFRIMVEQRMVLRGIDALCGPCVDVADPSRGLVWFDYATSLGTALVVASVISWLAYRAVIRRLSAGPALVATVATIGVAQLLASATAGLPGLLATAEQKETSSLPHGVVASPPFDLIFRWDPATFRAPQILTVAVAVVGALSLAWFLRRSRTGIAVRASSENAERASTVGIPVARVTGRVWALAGLAAGTAAVLDAMATASPDAVFDVTGLVRVLTVAVLARLVSLPWTVGAGLAVGVFDQAVLWTSGSTTVADGLLVVVLAVVLALQRTPQTRGQQDASAWRGMREGRPIPPPLREVPTVRAWLRGGVGIGAFVLLGLPAVLSSSQANAATITMLYAIVGLSLLVLTGWAGQVSLGQFALAATGAWAAAVSGLPMPVAVAVGGLAGAAAAVVIGVPSLRLRGIELAVTTLALAVSASTLLLAPSYGGRWLPDRLDRPSALADERTFYYLVLVVLVVVVVAVMGLRRSRTTRALIAARDNERAAQTFGVDVVRARVIAFAISGFLAASAGALFAYHQRGVRAASFSPETSVLLFLMVVIGGLGSVWGPLLGAVYVGLLTFLAASPLVAFLATGGGVVVLLLVAPGGLARVLTDVRDAVLRSVAARQGIEVPRLGAERRDRAPIAPNLSRAGSAAFVPDRYRTSTRHAGGLPTSGGDGPPAHERVGGGPVHAGGLPTSGGDGPPAHDEGQEEDG